MRAIVFGLLVLAVPAAAQDTLRLAVLQDAAVNQDPRLRQLALEQDATGLRLRNMGVERLPAFRITGQASHQSEVAALPVDLPNVEVPAPPAQRYEVALNADWLLFDGGVLGARRDVERARLGAARAELAAALYPMRTEVLEAFFNALVLQERRLELTALVEDLGARLAEVRDHVAAGAALPGDTAVVRAELLRSMQQRSEVESRRAAALGVLEELTGRDLSQADVLEIPDLGEAVRRVRSGPGVGRRQPADGALPAAHPQYAVFDARRERLERQAALARASLGPQVSAFGELAYGRPGFQQFTDEPHDYWLAGLRVQWAPWNWGTTDREVERLRIQRQILDTEEAAFSARLARQVEQPRHDMDRLRSAIETDEQIIALREQVERQARAQFAERAISAAAYVDARTDLQEARSTLFRHRAELARARARYLAMLGIALRRP